MMTRQEALADLHGQRTEWDSLGHPEIVLALTRMIKRVEEWPHDTVMTPEMDPAMRPLAKQTGVLMEHAVATFGKQETRQ
jgi:hypothetical protein